MATKQLLETLTHWSRGSATESEVSDVYVRLGYEFNIACRAFNAIGVDTGDLGPVPDLLRGILEDTLSQEASQQSLDKFLPRIRDIIINLLHGLKKKQQRLRQRTGTSRDGSDSRPPRQGSTASNTSLESNLTQQLEDVPTRASSARTYGQRQGSGEMAQPDLPPRTTSVPTGRGSPRRQDPSPQNSIHRQSMSKEKVTSPDSDSTLSSTAMQNIPVITPYPEADTMPSNQGYEQDQPSPTPPRPPPKQNDALTALQKGGDLERRASRRFSAYQIQKHLGTSVNGMPTIPPAQNSPIPNRGRDVRESMNAVRTRGSVLHSRARSRHQPEYEPSPNRDVRRISEEPGLKQDEIPTLPKPAPANEQLDSPTVKTPEDKLGGYPFPESEQKEEEEVPAATTNGPMDEPFTPNGSYTGPPSEKRKAAIPARNRQTQAQSSPREVQFVPESSPQPGKELTLFLQYKSKIKKFVLPDGADLTIPRLQLAFIEKFAWNTHSNGNDLPEIYIQDPVSGVRHELEDLSDIKERSVLVLNVEALDEVKRHIDDGIGGLRRVIEEIRTSVDGQQTAIQRVSDRQQDAAKEMATLAIARPQNKSNQSNNNLGRKTSLEDAHSQLTEVQSLRRDLAVVRQTYTTFVSDMTASMDTVRTKASQVKQQAATASIPSAPDTDSGRSYVNAGKKSLSDDSEAIVSRVDDLQDIVEDLRKDVVTRGVRPLPRQLETVSKDISTATSELKKLQEFLKREKPVWTKIWERELQVVCDDREILTMQEELAADLEDDLEKAAQTFALVEQATKQQNLANTSGGGGGAAGQAGGVVAGTRTPSGKLNPVAFDRGADPHKAKDGVLGEVRALQPNHESRLEAIERAEKARQRELEGRRDGAFQKELGSFVQEGKLKKSGGVEEVERIRIVREERARKEWADLQARRREERAKKMEQGETPGPEVQSMPAVATEAEGVTNGEAPAGGVEVPELSKTEGDREIQSSPEPVFLEANEDVYTPKDEEVK